MLLEVRDVSVRYAGAVVLNGVSLNVNEGEIVTIIGSNGAGKTTILRTISGLKRPATGEIIFQGKKIEKTLAQNIVKMGIGHVPEGRDLFPGMPVVDNLKLGAYLQRDKNQIAQNLEKVFRTFPVLKARKNQHAGTLSGGEQQMLAIARALMGGPFLLLLDEPSTGLAPIVVREIGKIVREINRSGTSVLLVEQNARLALKLAHRGYVLETGSVVLQGKSEDLIVDERVKKAYLGQ
jgi:branched-chain amino acid transport system ATP-binding protein